MERSELDLLDSIGNPVFVLDLRPSNWLQYIAWNQAAVDRSAIPREDVIGKTALEVYPGRLGRIAYERHAMVAKSGKADSYEIALPLKVGERTVRTTLTPLSEPDGQVRRLVGSTVDLSSEREQRQNRIQASAEITALTSEMEQFISMAAHDLRSPMLNVQNIAFMLREDFEDLGDGKLELIDLLENVGVQATSLITDVLSYARATNTQARQSVFDLEELCANIFVVLDPQSRHELTSVQAELFSDDIALQIILRNLVDNAIKHAGKESVDVRVSVREGAEEYLEFEVRDNGRGFDDPAIVFLGGGKFRAESGFGLLGIRRLINSRGGEISAEAPETGVGSIVRFTFPGKAVSIAAPKSDLVSAAT